MTGNEAMKMEVKGRKAWYWRSLSTKECHRVVLLCPGTLVRKTTTDLDTKER